MAETEAKKIQSGNTLAQEELTHLHKLATSKNQEERDRARTQILDYMSPVILSIIETEFLVYSKISKELTANMMQEGYIAVLIGMPGYIQAKSTPEDFYALRIKHRIADYLKGRPRARRLAPSHWTLVKNCISDRKKAGKEITIDDICADTGLPKNAVLHAIRNNAGRDKSQE